MTGQARQQLVYGEVAESLVFVPVDQAEELAGLCRAVESATTWGELRANISLGRYEELLELTESQPAESDSFDSADVDAICEGDWPEWPAQRMLDWMPQEVNDRFGEIETATMNGEMLVLDPNRTQEIVEELERHGFSCRREQQLVSEASFST